MKKILVALLVLAMVAPAMAVVDFAVVDNTDGTATITINTNGAVVRGVALSVACTGGAKLVDLSCISPNVDLGFNTCIDYAFSTPVGYDIGVGHPYASATGAGVAAVNDTTFSVSLGVLDKNGGQAGFTGSTNLATINTGAGNVCIDLDSLRGGVVGDGTITTNLDDTATICQTITVAPTDWISGPAVVTKTTAAPAAATRVNSGRVETFSVSGVTGSSAIEYQFTFGDATTSAWSTATTATKTYTYTASTTYNVTVQARLVSNPAMSVTSAPLACQSECVKSTATFYATWAAWNRPACWGYQRNCRGDTNSLATGLGVNRQWVNGADLTLLSAGFNKTEANLALVTNGICADTNRLATGLGVNRQWVNGADLTVLSGYFNKTEASVPICPQTNYHYWTSNTILY